MTHSDRPPTRKKPRGFSLIELMVVVAIIGILAAIAIPSLQKSVRRSRTVEALMSLRKIFDSSVTYVHRELVDEAGQVLPPQFPGSQGRTPYANPPEGQKTDPRPGDWDAATWQALNFGVTDPYYYIYQYLSGGTRLDAGFTGAAFGNLDGDTVESTFFRGGEIVDGNEVRGWPGVARLRELE